MTTFSKNQSFTMMPLNILNQIIRSISSLLQKYSKVISIKWLLYARTNESVQKWYHKSMAGRDVRRIRNWIMYKYWFHYHIVNQNSSIDVILRPDSLICYFNFHQWIDSMRKNFKNWNWHYLLKIWVLISSYLHR